jgi:tRNA-binding protein
MISWEDFEKIDIRTGTILDVNDFAGARKPAYQLTIDFGALGIKKSSAQITALYTKEEIVGKQVIAVENDEVVLLHPSLPVKNGSKVG